MRLSHKKKIAHKKGTYHPRLTYSLSRVCSSKWQKRLARKLALNKAKGITVEINSSDGSGDYGDMVGRAFTSMANAFRRLANVAVRPFKGWSLSGQGVTGHNKTINQV
ncbi:hypothetical protein [Photobacterium damselae]|uniref:hypothetical protein n=1 Tax=Photobacterium damselae TaxID=38293 RepID=UPI001EFE7899|nr:hypothetical protein [Photobacterium damselae]MCG9780443.1 hypothetical protein [Photobacterium damselae]